jgi:hypothetical protein
MRDVIKLGGDIAFEDLNPHNFHLKNDYINNLLFTALNILPPLAKYNIKPKILLAFVSNSYAQDNLEEYHTNPLFYKFTQGLALRITWDNYSQIDAITIIPDILKDVKSNVYAYLNQDESYVDLYFEMKDTTKVFEIIDGITRQIS